MHDASKASHRRPTPCLTVCLWDTSTAPAALSSSQIPVRQGHESLSQALVPALCLAPLWISCQSLKANDLPLCRQLSPRASNAERYSLMRKLTVTEPEAETLELCFDMTGKEGAGRLAHAGSRRPKAARRLQQVAISPCAATELKASPLPCSCACHGRSFTAMVGVL